MTSTSVEVVATASLKSWPRRAPTASTTRALRFGETGGLHGQHVLPGHQVGDRVTAVRRSRNGPGGARSDRLDCDGGAGNHSSRWVCDRSGDLACFGLGEQVCGEREAPQPPTKSLLASSLDTSLSSRPYEADENQGSAPGLRGPLCCRYYMQLHCQSRNGPEGAISAGFERQRAPEPACCVAGMHILPNFMTHPAPRYRSQFSSLNFERAGATISETPCLPLPGWPSSRLWRHCSTLLRAVSKWLGFSIRRGTIWSSCSAVPAPHSLFGPLRIPMAASFSER